MNTQLSLPVQLPDDETFNSFVVGSNIQLFEHLFDLFSKSPSDLPVLSFIHGEPGVGKSHLLFSVCHQAQQHNLNSLYIGLEHIQELSIGMFEGLEHSDLICIDDVGLLKGNPEWQEGLFDLINRIKEVGKCHLVLTASAGPKSLQLELADLMSRLTWGVSYKVHALHEEDKLLALDKRATQRGLRMPDEVARFLLTHWQRDMPALMATLDRLDKVSLREQRKLTIPFVKQALSI